MSIYSIYDANYVKHIISVKQGFNGVYYVYIDNKFYCSADTNKEAEDEINEYISSNKYKTVSEII